jgi:hypothetical protein
MSIELLQAYKDGFKDGENHVLEMLLLTTKMEFKTLTDLIQWVREQESK